MSDALAAALEGLGAQSDAPEGAAGGFHRRHVVALAALPDLARAFDAAGAFLEMMTCEDRRDPDAVMRLVYTFNWFERTERHVVFADVPADTCRAPSIVASFRAADWLEREVWDMYGVTFDGHPDMKRILLPEDVDFHALRKDFGRIEDAPEEAS